MADFSTIRSIIKSIVDGKGLAAADIDKLARAIVAASEGTADRSDEDAGVTRDAKNRQIEEIKLERDRAAALGRTEEYRRANLKLLQQQLDLHALDFKQKEATTDQRKRALEGIIKTEAAMRQLKEAQQEAAQAASFLGGVFNNTTKSFLSLGDSGVTVTGVYTGLKDLFSDLQGEQEDLIRIQEEQAEQTRKAAEATGDMTAELEEQKEATDQATDGLSRFEQVMGRISESKMGQDFQKQFAPLNQFVNVATQTFEVASNLDAKNQELYRSLGMVGEQGGKLRFEFIQLAKDSKSLSIESAEIDNAYKALVSTFKNFDSLAKENRQEVQRLFAVMEQAGVASEESAELFTFFNKALGHGVEESTQMTAEIMQLAEQLKRPPQEIAAAYNAGRKGLAAYGKDFNKVQKGMIAIAKKLNVEVGTMIGAFDALDTIEASAEAAVKINSILGLGVGQGVQRTELMTADITDKMTMIKAAVERAGGVDQAFGGEGGRQRFKEFVDVLKMDQEETMKFLRMGTKEMVAEMKKAQNIQKKGTKDIVASLEERTASQLTADQKAKLQAEELMSKETIKTAQFARDSIAENANALRLVGGGISTVMGIVAAKGSTAKMLAAVGGVTDLAGEIGAGGAGQYKGPTDAESLKKVGIQRVFVTNWEFGEGGAGGGGGGGGGEGGVPGAGGLGAFLTSPVGAGGAMSKLGQAGMVAAAGYGGFKVGQMIAEKAYGGTWKQLTTGFFGGTGGVSKGNPGTSYKGHRAKVNDFKTRVNANQSDEIIGVKEGGLIARKLDKLISLLSGGPGVNDREIVIKLDSKVVARSVVSTVNNDFYNAGI